MRARRILAAIDQWSRTHPAQKNRSVTLALSDLREELKDNKISDAAIDAYLDALASQSKEKEKEFPAGFADFISKLKQAPPLDPKTLLTLAHKISQQENPNKEEAARIIEEMNARILAAQWKDGEYVKNDAAHMDELLRARKDLKKIVDDVFNMPDNKYRLFKLIEEYGLERCLPISFQSELAKCTTEEAVSALVEEMIPLEHFKNGLSVSQLMNDLNAGSFLGANLSYEQVEKFKMASLTNEELLDYTTSSEHKIDKKYIQEIHTRLLREDRPKSAELAIEKALKKQSEEYPFLSKKILERLSADLNQQVEKIDQYINKSLKEKILTRSVRCIFDAWNDLTRASKKNITSSPEPVSIAGSQAAPKTVEEYRARHRGVLRQQDQNQKAKNTSNLESIFANSRRIVNLNKDVKSLPHMAKETQKELNNVHAIVTALISLTGVGLAYTIPKMIESKKKHGTVFFTHVTPKVVVKHATEELQGKPSKPKPR